MASVALIVHRLRPEAVRVAQETAVWLRERGHDVRMAPEEADELDLRDCACDPEKLAAGLDLAVSLGGDGTMLRTVELVAHEGVPVLGVNIGRLGYLTELDPAQLPDALDRFLSGSYDLEERMMLSGSVSPGIVQLRPPSRRSLPQEPSLEARDRGVISWSARRRWRRQPPPGRWRAR